jgi:hypothetical protein
MVVGECEKFFEGLGDDERYDIIQDEIDSLSKAQTAPR